MDFIFMQKYSFIQSKILINFLLTTGSLNIYFHLKVQM